MQHLCSPHKWPMEIGHHKWSLKAIVVPNAKHEGYNWSFWGSRVVTNFHWSLVRTTQMRHFNDFKIHHVMKKKIIFMSFMYFSCHFYLFYAFWQLLWKLDCDMKSLEILHVFLFHWSIIEWSSYSLIFLCYSNLH